MPWHDEYDFGHFEVNRYIIVNLCCDNGPVNCIHGFSRETLNAMVANIERREFRRCYLASRNLPRLAE